MSFDLQRLLDELGGLVRADRRPVEMIRYGPSPEQVGDLRLPDGPGPHPVVAVVHGGFWRAAYTRATTAALAADLSRRGFAAWNVEYRRVGCDGGVPATLEDVEAALAAVHRLAAPLERHRPPVVLGHSAGGHLALWAAGTGGVRAAVALAPVADLAAAAREGLGAGAALELCGGGPDERPAAYTLADPLGRLPTGVPTVLVHGAEDDRVPVEQSRRYAAAARAAGDPCRLLELPRTGHFEPIDPRTAAWRHVADALERL